MISAKELAKLLKTAKKHGVKRLKIADLEFEFGDPSSLLSAELIGAAKRLGVRAAAQKGTPPAGEDLSGEPMPTEDEFLHWSTPAQPPPPEDETEAGESA